MKLDHAAILKIATGVVSTDPGEHGGLLLKRFTDAQKAVYAPNEAWRIRAQASSGIRLECDTDAAAMKLDFAAIPGSAWDLYGFDLKVDGKLYAHHEGRIADAPAGEWRVELPAGSKRLALYLPCLTGTEICGLELTEATFCAPVAHRHRLLCLGDSITQGYYAHFPSMAYTAIVAAGLDAEVVNQAIGGAMFYPAMLDPDMAYQPTLITVAYGTNDWRRHPRTQFEADAGAYMDKLCGIWPDVPVRMITPIWRADCGQPEYEDFPFADAHKILCEIAARHANAALIDGAELFPQIHHLMEDGRLHPNDLGFTIYGERLLAKLSMA